MPVPALDGQPRGDRDGIGATPPRRIVLGIGPIFAVTCLFISEVDLAACPGCNWVLGGGIFFVLARTLPH
ncbi:hypothetical protein PY365_20345 [Roseiarcaceae bacterium H3SJ34-1]|uniref:hypothetical protein n=1 Tax=Terripilifer ovatus TaxID=3032367 RepID=UPI003AB955A2|nr:hypothetical protein [Roseiarcaceae bacterium H3SJ34-1]